MTREDALNILKKSINIDEKILEEIQKIAQITVDLKYYATQSNENIDAYNEKKWLQKYPVSKFEASEINEVINIWLNEISVLKNDVLNHIAYCEGMMKLENIDDLDISHNSEKMSENVDRLLVSFSDIVQAVKPVLKKVDQNKKVVIDKISKKDKEIVDKIKMMSEAFFEESENFVQEYFDSARNGDINYIMKEKNEVFNILDAKKVIR